jgi:hypothetical protein
VIKVTLFILCSVVLVFICTVDDSVGVSLR